MDEINSGQYRVSGKKLLSTKDISTKRATSLPDILYNNFSCQEADKLDKYRELLNKLPSINYNTLRRLVGCVIIMT